LIFIVAQFVTLYHVYTVIITRTSNVSVPMNVDFVSRRYGEWVMLMLGEGVLSLLLVDIVQSLEYYVTFIAGLISIILLQYLHYQSQPTDPNSHAIRRSITSSFLFYWLMQLYSLALIVFGACYKIFLYEYIYRNVEQKTDTSTKMRGLLYYGIHHHHRYLADGSATLSTQLSTEERQQRDAHFFSGSLSLIFFCLDALSLAHRGIHQQWKRCQECENTGYKKFLCWFLLSCRIVLILFVASLSQYVTNPTQLAAIGVTVVVTQLCIRFLGYFVFHAESDVEERALERVIHYNTARIDEHHDMHSAPITKTFHN
jgi:hypothetical protein